MISIEKVRIQESNYLHIKSIHDYFDLTNANSKYHGSPSDGGIKVLLELSIESISSGYIYITQRCNRHKVSIKTKSGQNYFFDPEGQMFKDTRSQTENHFNYYRIKNDTILDKHYDRVEDVIFFDAPFKELLPNWLNLSFYAEFETYFQYSTGNAFDNNLIPLISFKWVLDSEVFQLDNFWHVKHSKFTAPCRINNNINYHNNKDEAFNVSPLPNLFLSYKAWKHQHSELLKSV